MINLIVAGVANRRDLVAGVDCTFGKAAVNMGDGSEGDKIFQYGWYEADEKGEPVSATLVWYPGVSIIPTGAYTADELVTRIRESEKVAKERLKADQVYFFVNGCFEKERKGEA